MKTTTLQIIAAILCLTSSSISAQTTAFTYQGRLNHGAVAANGLYEINFTLYDRATNGTEIGSAITLAPVPVTNGLFTATLDFGAGAFTGADRWLEISLTVYLSDQPLVLLAPRQPITPTPYALHAANAGGVLTADGERAFRIESGSSAPNIIGGAPGNSVYPLVSGATIAGGGTANFYGQPGFNYIETDFGTIGGGMSNSIWNTSSGATIAGGMQNTIEWEGVHSTIAGGFLNVIVDDAGSATISGGRENEVLNYGGTISGGWGNRAGAYASVAGGQYNFAMGDFSTVAGGQSNTNFGGAANIGGGSGNFCEEFAGNATIGGGMGNQIRREAYAATIAGGSWNTIHTEALNTTISGGGLNTIFDEADAATIGGGSENTINRAVVSTIGGGLQNYIESHYSVIAGGESNVIHGSAFHATIAGGKYNVISDPDGTGLHAFIGGGSGNRANADAAVISGGLENSISGRYATIGGGVRNANTPDAPYGVIGGGEGNTNHNLHAAIGGGLLNMTSGDFTAIGGGHLNVAAGNYGTVPGGHLNSAGGTYSLAAGRRAKAEHGGAFVWADSTDADLTSSTNNQFTARAAGGVRFFTDSNATTGAELAPGSGTWSMLSDRNAKENFVPANPGEVLNKVSALPLATWNYKTQDKSVRHIGPTAQDFHATFGVGENDRTISTVDADGVALAAIQGLNQKVKSLEKEIADLKELVRQLSKN